VASKAVTGVNTDVRQQFEQETAVTLLVSDGGAQLCFQSKVDEVQQRTKNKDKVRHEGPEGKYRYISIISLTSALNGVGG
jgi:hypothetical protein